MKKLTVCATTPLMEMEFRTNCAEDAFAMYDKWLNNAEIECGEIYDNDTGEVYANFRKWYNDGGMTLEMWLADLD